MISTKVVAQDGNSKVALAILTRPGGSVRDGCSILDAQQRPLAPKGLHVLATSFFKRHNPVLDPRENSRLVCFDHAGYQSLRSTTYSLFPNQSDVVKGNHGAVAAAPGSSVLTVAAELVDVELTRTCGRVSEPIQVSKFHALNQHMLSTVLSERGEKAGNDAIVAAAAIIEILSAESFVSFRSNAFFKGALPTHFDAPNGLALTIAVAVRLAIYWTDNNLPRPTDTDIFANDRVRMIFETGQYSYLPRLGENKLWAIDVVLKGALRSCAVDVKGTTATADERVAIDDNKIFLQRLGQRLITSTFGVGSSAFVSAQKNEFGTPFALDDPLQVARDTFLINEAGCAIEGFDTPLLKFSNTSQRRTSLIDLLFDCETWLREGSWGGVQISPLDDTNSSAEGRKHTTDILQQLMLPQMVEDLALRVASKETYTSSYEAGLTDAMTGNFNLAAMGEAISKAKSVLSSGPTLHFESECGAYVVAATQTAPCTDCEVPVHVLEGVLTQHAYNYCSACNAKRCLSCAATFARQIRVTESQFVGKRCRRCGADAAFVEVHRSTKNGEDTFTLNLHPRKSTLPRANLQAFAIDGAGGATPRPNKGGGAGGAPPRPNKGGGAPPRPNKPGGGATPRPNKPGGGAPPRPNKPTKKQKQGLVFGPIPTSFTPYDERRVGRGEAPPLT